MAGRARMPASAKSSWLSARLSSNTGCIRTKSYSIERTGTSGSTTDAHGLERSMPVNPIVGRAGGQKYDVAKAIRTFLEQMAGGAGFSFGAAVIKELIQNADDAGATELIVALDERNGEGLPSQCRDAYAPLLEPAVLVSNDASFRVP